MPFSDIDLSAVRENLESDFQQELIQFEKKKAAYTKLREELDETIEEARNPAIKANTLERQANTSKTVLEQAIKNRHLSQDEISAELARIEAMKKEAQELRFTAQCREGKVKPLTDQLAILRDPLESAQRKINIETNKTLLNLTLNQPGIRDTLLKAFSLSRAITRAKLEVDDILLSHCINSNHREQETQKHISTDFINNLLQLFEGAEKETFPPQLVTLPSRAVGEAKMSLALRHKQRFAKQA